jgi:hypothetical protein
MSTASVASPCSACSGTTPEEGSKISASSQVPAAPQYKTELCKI